MELGGLGSEGRMFANAVTFTGGLAGVGGALVNAANPAFSSIKSLHRFTAFSIQLILRSLTGTFIGVWLIEASNNWCPDGGELGQVAYAGDWTDVSTLFTPSLNTAATANGTQFIEPLTKPNGWKAIRLTLTRTSGTSVIADPWFCGKGH